MKNSTSFRVLARGWRLFKVSWKPMAGYTLLVWASALVVLSPLTSWILNRLVSRSGELVVGNAELITWLLSPEGLLSLTLWGVLALLGLVLQVTGLIWIAGDDAPGNVRVAGRALYRLLPALPHLFRFCFKAFLLCLLASLPLVAGLAAVYRLFLGAHDINYYLTIRPAEWRWAIVCGGFWLLLWAAAAGSLLLRWVYAFPLWLDGVYPFRSALSASWQATRRSFFFLLRVSVLCLASVMLAHLLMEGSLFAAAGLVIRHLGDALTTMFFTISIYLISNFVMEAAISFISIAWITCVLVICYRDDRPATLTPKDLRTDGFRKEKPPASSSHLLRPRIIFAALGGLLVAGLVVSLHLLNQKPPGKVPLVIAHRAGALYAPENTLAAMEIAIGQKADYAEIDVQRSRDGIVVVNHDADLMKMARDPRRIRETDYADLARVDIGRMFHSDFAGERVAPLADFLKKAAGRIKLMIELKYYGGDPQLVEETVRLVRETGMEDEVALMSLDLASMRQCQKLAPQLAAGYLSSVGLGDLSRLDLDFLAVSTGVVSAPLLRNAGKQGLSVYVWTVNDADAMLDMMELGVDGLITDDSALAVEVIRSVQALLPAERLLLRFRHFWDRFEDQNTGKERLP